MRHRSSGSLWKVVFAIVSSALLLSCNTGSSDGRSVALASAAAGTPAGIFFGTITADGAQPVNYQAIGIISENFEVQMPVFVSSQLHYAGQVTASGTAVSGTLTEYRGAWRRFSGLDGVSSVDLDGTVSSADGMVATFNGQSSAGQMSLDYSAIYEDGSSLDSTAGVWSFGEAFLGGGAYAVTLDIDANGLVFGSDSDGCIFSGSVSIIDDRYNVYSASIRIDNCGDFDGGYNGLAFLADAGGGRLNQLTLSVSNESFAFFSVFGKN